MSYEPVDPPSNYDQQRISQHQYDTQTNMISYDDLTPHIDENHEDDNDGRGYSNSRSRHGNDLSSTRHGSGRRTPLSQIVSATNTNNQEQSSDDEKFADGRKIMTPTKYRLQENREKRLRQQKNRVHQEQSENSNGSEREISQSPERPQPSRYDQLEQPKKRNGYVPDSSSPYHDDSDPEISTSHLQRQPSSQIHKESKSPPYQQTQSNKRSDYIQRSPSRQQPQQSVGNIDQDHLIPLRNRYRITSVDIELEPNPTDKNSSTSVPRYSQMQLIFRGTAQGSDVQERAEHSLNEIVGSQNRTQDVDIYTADHAASHDRSNEKSTHDDHSSAIKLNGQSNNHSSTSNPLAPSDGTTIHADNYDYEDPRSKNQHSSKNNMKSNSSKIHSKPPGNLPDSSDSSESESPPPKSSERKAQYYFGEKGQNQLSDDDNDEPECETIGRNSQTIPSTNSDTKRYLNHSSIKKHQPSTDDSDPENSQFGKQTDARTSTGNTPTQNERLPSSKPQTTPGTNRDSQRTAPIRSPYDQAPVNTNYEIADSDPATNSSSLRKQNIPLQYQANPGHPRPNTGININDDRSPANSNQNTRNKKQPRYDTDDDSDDGGYQDDGGISKVADNTDRNSIDGNDSDRFPSNDRPVVKKMVTSNPVTPRSKRNEIDEIQPSPVKPKPRTKNSKKPAKAENKGLMARIRGWFGGNNDKDVSKTKKKTLEKKPTKTNKKPRSTKK